MIWWSKFPSRCYLEHGYHEVVLEYYENGGGACTLWWVNPEGQYLVRPEGEKES